MQQHQPFSSIAKPMHSANVAGPIPYRNKPTLSLAKLQHYHTPLDSKAQSLRNTKGNAAGSQAMSAVVSASEAHTVACSNRLTQSRNTINHQTSVQQQQYQSASKQLQTNTSMHVYQQKNKQYLHGSISTQRSPKVKAPLDAFSPRQARQPLSIEVVSDPLQMPDNISMPRKSQNSTVDRASVQGAQTQARAKLDLSVPYQKPIVCEAAKISPAGKTASAGNKGMTVPSSITSSQVKKETGRQSSRVLPSSKMFQQSEQAHGSAKMLLTKFSSTMQPNGFKNSPYRLTYTKRNSGSGPLGLSQSKGPQRQLSFMKSSIPSEISPTSKTNQPQESNLNSQNAQSFNEFQSLDAALKSRTFKQTVQGLQPQLKSQDQRSRQTDLMFKNSVLAKRDLQFRFVPGVKSYAPSAQGAVADKRRRRNLISYDGSFYRQNATQGANPGSTLPKNGTPQHHQTAVDQSTSFWSQAPAKQNSANQKPTDGGALQGNSNQYTFTQQNFQYESNRKNSVSIHHRNSMQRKTSRHLDETRLSMSSASNTANLPPQYSHSKARSRVRLMTDYNAASSLHHQTTQRLYTNRATNPGTEHLSMYGGKGPGQDYHHELNAGQNSGSYMRSLRFPTTPKSLVLHTADGNASYKATLCDNEQMLQDEADYLSTGEPITLNFQAMGLQAQPTYEPAPENKIQEEDRVAVPLQAETIKKIASPSSLNGGSPRRQNYVEDDGDSGGGEKANSPKRESPAAKILAEPPVVVFKHNGQNAKADVKLSLETAHANGAFIDIDASVRIFLQHPQDTTTANPSLVPEPQQAKSPEESPVMVPPPQTSERKQSDQSSSFELQENNSMTMWSNQFGANFAGQESTVGLQSQSEVQTIQIEIATSSLSKHASPNARAFGGTAENQNNPLNDSCDMMSSDEEIPDESIAITASCNTFPSTSILTQQNQPQAKNGINQKSLVLGQRPETHHQQSSSSGVAQSLDRLAAIGSLGAQNSINQNISAGQQSHRTSAAALPRPLMLIPSLRQKQTMQLVRGSLASQNSTEMLGEQRAAIGLAQKVVSSLQIKSMKPDQAQP